MADLRKTGIDIVGDIPWGSHFCSFYETKQDLLDTLVPYFKAGLESKEFCLWVVSDSGLISVEEAKQALEQTVPHLDRHLSDKNIEILNGYDWYLDENIFNLDKTINAWNAKLRSALALGYSGMRVSGDTFWLREKDWKDFYDYEKQLNDSITGAPITLFCTYPLAKSGAAVILDVVHTHQFAVARRNGEWEIIETPELKQANAEIKRLNNELEQRVNERTRQLAKAIEELKYEIAEHKKSEEELRLAYQSLSYHVENTPLAVIEFDKDLYIKRWSKRAEVIFGWKASEVLGKNVYDPDFPIIYKDDIKEVDKINDQLIKGTVAGNLSHNRNYTRDGTVIDCEWHNSVLRDEDGRVITILSLVHNVTERKKAEETLNQSYNEIRRLTEHLQNIREEERANIAREIHDELGQQLTVLKMDVRGLNKKLSPTDGPIKQKIADIIDLLDATVKSVRRISSELRPNLLHNLGLVAAMEWHLNEFEKRSGIEVIFNKSKKELKLPDSIKNGLFRIFQESLTNISRHANANTIKVAINQKNQKITLSIEDDGQGFEIEKIATKQTFGILGMKERSQMMGGNYEIRSRPGKGTTVIVAVPNHVKEEPK
jgi:PAS domain S-box-containing protein